MKLLVAVPLLAMTVAIPNLDELKQMSARYAPVELKVDVSKLSSGDRAALVPLVRAAHEVDQVFLSQYWSGDHALYAKLQQDKSPLGRARLHYFWLNKGPWSTLDDNRAFLPDVPEHKPLGSNFYPEDMAKAEFESWVKTLSPAERKSAEGFFTVIRRSNGKLTIVPFSSEYRQRLEALAADLREAASKTDNATLKRFLETRAAAFLSNDYYESDLAWMDLDAPIDVTIGPTRPTTTSCSDTRPRSRPTSTSVTTRRRRR